MVHSTYTAVIVWLVWFPAWFVGACVVACGLFGGREKGAVDRLRVGGEGRVEGRDANGQNAGDDMALKQTMLAADVTASS